MTTLVATIVLMVLSTIRAPSPPAIAFVGLLRILACAGRARPAHACPMRS